MPSNRRVSKRYDQALESFRHYIRYIAPKLEDDQIFESDEDIGYRLKHSAHDIQKARQECKYPIAKQRRLKWYEKTVKAEYDVIGWSGSRAPISDGEMSVRLGLSKKVVMYARNRLKILPHRDGKGGPKNSKPKSTEYMNNPSAWRNEYLENWFRPSGLADLLAEISEYRGA